MKKFNKIAMCTDIHFGRKNNSEVHNKDCLSYLDWFCDNVRNDPDIDAVCFLGDWHEHRAAVSGTTLHYSYMGAKKLNDLGIPVLFLAGNHDLVLRNKRDMFTTNPFDSLHNFTVIHEEPLVLEKNDAVIFPYLFEDEYHSLIPKYTNHSIFFGHFSFKGFVLTGESRINEHGPDHTVLKKLKRIFSGHFHKRQVKDNVAYIGNTFPADFGDANDFDRGMATYNFNTDELNFINWVDCPKYIRSDLSKFLDKSVTLHKESRVIATVDLDLTFEDAMQLKQMLIKKYKLRELTFDEVEETNTLLKDTVVDISHMESETTDTIVIEMLSQIESDQISSAKLVKIFEGLPCH